MYIFEHPKINELFNVLLENLLEESGRGAILIATAHADDFLTELIEITLPDEISKKERERLLNYPGHLSSFSAKIELAFAFRLISKTLRDSLNALRKVRNDAAHSSLPFDLFELQQKMESVYDLGSDTPIVIRNAATRMLVTMKIGKIAHTLKNAGYSDEEKNKVLADLPNDKENMDIINKQIPHWELIYGICLICGMIVNSTEQISKVKTGINTWGDLLPKES
ncbi:hypothetical protein [Fluviicola chungangensis]|uniref:DUF4145 domain-containing protein n=1 Tax=Fluviicola chungangensis TaxID=2597671 RepID=A0A556MND7_9FLAO|nr:hypothetical protein [Fluviicola chungangensis]TSJ41487.1 hypothetical protein FO442_13560 [Fluviicola chungangensis]